MESAGCLEALLECCMVLALLLLPAVSAGKQHIAARTQSRQRCRAMSGQQECAASSLSSVDGNQRCYRLTNQQDS